MNRFVGQYVGGNKQGTKATFDAQTFLLCNVNDAVTASMAYTVVQGPGGGIVGSDIVQMGMGRCKDFTGFSQCSGQMRLMWAWGRSSCGLPKVPTVVDVGAAPTVATTFYVTHTAGYWRGYVGLGIKGQVPQGEICWTPGSAAWFNESWDYGDALGGTSTDRFYFTSMRMQNAQGGAWISPSLNSASNCTWGSPEGGTKPFFCDIWSSDGIRTWSDR